MLLLDRSSRANRERLKICIEKKMHPFLLGSIKSQNLYLIYFSYTRLCRRLVRKYGCDFFSIQIPYILMYIDIFFRKNAEKYIIPPNRKRWTHTVLFPPTHRTPVAQVLSTIYLFLKFRFLETTEISTWELFLCQ